MCGCKLTEHSWCVHPVDLLQLSFQRSHYWQKKVGHTEDELDPAKTLAALYLDPLLQIIAGEKESATV